MSVNTFFDEETAQEALNVRQYFIASFSGQYALNDSMHHIKHFDEVCLLMMELNDYFGLGINQKMMATAAYLHDMFAAHRSVHANLAAEYSLNADDSLLNDFNSYERWSIARACAEHRASYKGEFSTSLSELLSAADRRYPGNAQDLVHGSYTFYKTHTGNEQEALRKAYQYVKEKDGRAGYAVYPRIYKEYFSERLEKRAQEIEQLPDDPSEERPDDVIVPEFEWIREGPI